MEKLLTQNTIETFFNKFIIRIVLAKSKFPVGSSAKITDGDFAIALAIATRCCCPLERFEASLYRNRWNSY